MTIAITALTCVGCGQQFEGDPQRLYCSDRCKWRSKSQRRYVPVVQGTRVCSLCKDKHASRGVCVAHRDATRERAETRTGICTNCGATWTKDHKTTTTLCWSCVIAARGTFAHNYRNMDKRGRRRAIQLGNEAETVDVLAAFERDNWTCQVCGNPVDRSLMWRHPQSASLDHRLPLSRGGGHTETNVQLAHLNCNVRKSDNFAAIRRI